jgi:hypothetical protein
MSLTIKRPDSIKSDAYTPTTRTCRFEAEVIVAGLPQPRLLADRKQLGDFALQIAAFEIEASPTQIDPAF